jgi:hypothetical protein
MAAASPEEGIHEVLGLRQTCTQTLSDDIMRRITLVREKCALAEKAEQGGSVQWRRGPNGVNTGGHGGGGHGSGGRPGSAIQSNRWRNGPPSATGRQGTSSGQPHMPHQYVSKFTNADAAVEDKILNKVILNKLNTFSQANYEEVKAFLQQILDSNETDFLKDFMLLVFKKAANEPVFCPLYARMISELSQQYPILRAEMEELYTKYISIFEEVSEEECTDYEQFVQRNREKFHRLGYSQFLAELSRLGILEQAQLQQLYETILIQIKLHAGKGTARQNLVDEYVDCLLQMTRAFQKGITQKVTMLRIAIGKVCEPIMEDILARRTGEFPGMTKKAVFGIMDCLDIFRGNTGAA